MVSSFPKILSGGGKAGELIRNYDWAATRVGEPGGWPASLLITLSNLLRSPVPMLLYWGEKYICFCNDAYLGHLPAGHKELPIGKAARIVWGDQWKAIKPLLDRVWKDARSTLSESMGVPPLPGGPADQGSPAYAYGPVLNEDGEVNGILAVFKGNIDTGENAYKAGSSNIPFEDLVRNAPVGIVVVMGREMRVEIVNESYALLVGRTMENLLHRPLFESIPDAAEPFQSIIEKVRQTGEPAYLYDHPRGIYVSGKRTEGYVNIIYQPLKQIDGTISGVIVLCQDVTSRWAYRKQLEESEDRFRRLIEQAPIPMCFYTGEELRIRVINDALLEVWGKEKSVVGKTLLEVFPELGDQPFLDLLRNVYTSRQPFSLRNSESKIFRDGALRTLYFDLWYTPIIDDKTGKVFGILASGVDVGEKVLLQKKTEESEMHFKMMVEHATVAIALTKGPDMIFENINTPMLQLIHRTPGVIGKPLLEVMPELKGQLVQEILTRAFITGESYNGIEIPATLMVDGKPENRFYNISYLPLTENNITTWLLHIAIDVTRQVVTRQLIEEAEAKTRLAIESANLGTYEINLLTQQMTTSDRFTAIWGAHHRTMPRSQFVSFIHPDDRELRRQAHQEALLSGKLHYEARIIWKDNTTHWVRVDGIVVYDTTGKPATLIGVIQDITEQKIIQQRKDNFIAMASHELKTPLTSIKAYAQIIGMMLSDRGMAEESRMMGKIDQQIDNLGSLVADLLNTSKLDTGTLDHNRTCFGINDCVSQLVEQLQRTTTHVLQPDLDVPVNVYAERNRIGQVMTNFIVNAIKYSPRGTTIEIKTEIASGNVVFSVQDFGIGINKEQQPLVFNQFYRVNNATHQSYPGLGLGLYISATIIQKEGGKIWLESIEDEGSTFYFSLPVWEEEKP